MWCKWKISGKKISLHILKLLMVFFVFSYSLHCESLNLKLRNIYSQYNGDFIIVVNKKKFRLYVYDRKRKIKASFRISIGQNPDLKAKLYEGDLRTPEGLYHITEIYSQKMSENSEGFQKLADLNDLYLKAEDGNFRYGHPKRDLGKKSYGPRFLRLNYPNPEDLKRHEEESQKVAPKKNESDEQVVSFPGPGSGIAIHGTNDSASIGHLATKGCVGMRNKDIIQLDKYIQAGTPVLILHK